MEERQLQWVQKNRQRRQRWRTATIGELAEELVKSSKISGPAWRRKLIAVLEAHGGPALLEHAKIVEVRNGELILQVAEPAVRYQLKLLFEQRLLDVIHAELPESGIHAVRFTLGSRD